MTLFHANVPHGFHYRDDFISASDEALLADEIGRVAFSAFEMRGVVARRRVAFFGASYDDAPGRLGDVGTLDRNCSISRPRRSATRAW